MGGITPLSGTTSEEHMKEDVAVEQLVVPDEVQELMRGLNKGYGIELEL